MALGPARLTGWGRRHPPQVPPVVFPGVPAFRTVQWGPWAFKGKGVQRQFLKILLAAEQFSARSDTSVNREEERACCDSPPSAERFRSRENKIT